jgi:hypothetical protein
MLIHKSHSKTDLIDLINDIGLPIVFSHQDNKKNIHDKYIKLISDGGFHINHNFYNIETIDGLINYLENTNPKKPLTIKEKQNVMLICKHIINYCKNNFDIESSKYESLNDIIDDMDFIKQFGDIPSVRRCCRLMNKHPTLNNDFKPLLSPQCKKVLDEKIDSEKNKSNGGLTIRRSTPDNPVVVMFD